MSEDFERVRTVFANDLMVPLDSATIKVLYFMLHEGCGCDVTMASSQFYIQYGRNPSYSRYSLDIAPGVASYLWHAAPNGALPRGLLPWWDPAISREPWMYGPHRVWFNVSTEHVRIAVRDAASDVPASEPPPLGVPQPEYIQGAQACEHCGVVPERYRKLLDGALVCLACGRSSSPSTT